MKIIVVVPNYWGKGDSKDEAIKQARKNGAAIVKRSTPMVVYAVEDDDAYCNDVNGGLCVKRGTKYLTVERINTKKEARK